MCWGNVADYYPEEKVLYPGGSAFNVAVLARRYGLKTAYLGTFGSDTAGKYLIEVLKDEGVDYETAPCIDIAFFSAVGIKDDIREFMPIIRWSFT